MMSLARDGLIDLRGKTHDEIANELAHIADAYEWAPVIDYTEDILAQARVFREAKQDLLAIVFYALWLEHTLNRIVASLANRKGVPPTEIETLIRDTSYRAKCTWVFRLLDCEPFDTEQLNLIIRVMETRNSFIHYKWKSKSPQATQEPEVTLSRVEESVGYIQQYEAEHLLGLSRDEIAQIAKLL